MGVRQAMALIGNARQATSEGKSGPVETGLTGPAATARVQVTVFAWSYAKILYIFLRISNRSALR